MGASQSTAVDEGITVVHHGTRASAAQQDDMALLAQLAALMHSLPLLPESVAETGGTWTRALQRTLASSSSSSAAVAPAAVPHLSGDPLERLVADYQRYSRWHCRRIVEKQERLNSAIPLVEQQAVRLQHRLAQAGRSAAAAHRALAPAVAEAAREVEAMAARLARLQQALAEVRGRRPQPLLI
ncbi:transcription factor Iws1 [Micractinium conductrix]|uniref:Transcription factor Iws1 n=1 Tax=Micractinium conductrix TaxID=554055 RepID=A0A2P6VAF7_9CHLO|nr:transcription factor Iws1 [Micractinium conductrix]|eukprot:PSC71074.1 transcription factor Iws1 [Micractinium conductrix]